MIDKTFVILGLLSLVIYAVMVIALHMQKRESFSAPDKKEVLSTHGVGVFSVVLLSLAFPISWQLRVALFAVLGVLIVLLAVLETNDNLTQVKDRIFSKKAIGIFSIALIFCLSLFVYRSYQFNAAALQFEAQRIAANNAKFQTEQQALNAAKTKNLKTNNKSLKNNPQALSAPHATVTYEAPPSFFKTNAPTLALLIGSIGLLQLMYLVLFVGDKGRANLWWISLILLFSTISMTFWSVEHGSPYAPNINAVALLLCVASFVILWAYKNTYNNNLSTADYQNYAVERPPSMTPAPQPAYISQETADKEMATAMAVSFSTVVKAHTIEPPLTFAVEALPIETVHFPHAGVEAIKKKAMQKMQLRNLEAELDALKETADLIWQTIKLSSTTPSNTDRSQQLTRHEQTLQGIEKTHNKIVLLKQEMAA
jgi:hypothetical protein